MRTLTARRRTGVALLEALIALSILSIAGAATATMVIDAARTVQRARASDDETRDASALLHAIALWPRDDLDRHLGARAQGRWSVRVGREMDVLYTVTIYDSTGRRLLFSTSLYRPDTDATEGHAGR